jgi:hypothetical protein
VRGGELGLELTLFVGCRVLKHRGRWRKPSGDRAAYDDSAMTTERTRPPVCPSTSTAQERELAAEGLSKVGMGAFVCSSAAGGSC